MEEIKDIASDCINRWGSTDENTTNLSNKIGKFISQLGDDRETGEIILSLLKEYNYYSRAKIDKILVSFYNKVNELELPKYRTIYSRIDKGSKINSSSNLLEEFKILNNIGNSFSHDLEKLKESQLSKIECMVFIDDIIGSGKTVTDFFELHKDKIQNKTIIIFCIEIMEIGFNNIDNYLNSIGCSHAIFCHVKTKKAFSKDGIFKEKAEEKREKLRKFEKEQLRSNNYVLGFKESEALVSFYRNTPNNTLSSYWYTLNDKWNPLFPRDLERPDFMGKSGEKDNICYNLQKIMKEKGIDMECSLI